MNFFIKKTSKSLPITPLNNKSLKTWLKTQDKATREWVKSSDFKANSGSMLILPKSNGSIAGILFGAGEDNSLYSFSALPVKLPKNKAGYYIDKKMTKDDATKLSIGWALGSYSFDEYKSSPKKSFGKLVLPLNADKKYLNSTIEAIFLVRNLINIPANDMTPQELANAAKKLAKRFNTTSIKIISGEDLLKKNFPAIYEVGKASPNKPRLIDLKWGNKNHPKLTLVGKGVCYDTGGLNLKPGNSMALMKKDMGGAAHVLGLAHMIMTHKLPVRLRVLIPAVENSLNGNSYRPGDIIKTRKGLSVEIGNTDAEGRLVLADALAEASKEKPDMIIDFATLTGAARVALGPDIPPMFSNDDKLANSLQAASNEAEDPLWRLPLWKPYNKMIKSENADINNAGVGGFAGSITAALFLEHFVEKEIPWIHIDTYGWNPIAKAGRPKGGEALGMRASYKMLEKKFGKNKPK